MDKNLAQEEAIRTTNGALLIISCPGSGKTTTMLRRIEYMLSVGIPASQILMVTFTEAAAREMRERFQKLHAGSSVTFCTIHSLCLKIINESGTARGHRILDSRELNEIVRAAVKETGVFLDDFKKIRNDISRFKNTGEQGNRTEGNVDDMQFMEIVRRYEDKKNEVLGHDFDDLLILARELMLKNAVLRDRYADQYRYVICDEYQDTNPIQKDVLYLLVKKYGNLCVVGDDDQSIYGFRGATPGLMIQFPKDFPGCKVIKMGTNYRSLPHIIETAGKMIGNNRNRFTKEIKAHREGDGHINFIEDDYREDEIENIVNRLKKYQEGGKNLKDVAILARTNQELEDVAAMCIEKKIPFGGTETLNDMYESWMFNDICAYIRLSESEGEYARQDFIRIANRPKRYLEMKTLSMCEMTKEGINKAFYRAKAYIHDNIFDLFYDLSELKKLPFAKKVDYILDQIGYRKYVESYCESAGLSVTVQNTRLNQFRDDSQKFERLNDWLRYAMVHVKRFKDAVKERSANGVNLATMHRAKGLEWDTVFVIDCCDGNVPLMYNGKVQDIEEERRLFYVACTRAKNDLYITSYQKTTTTKGKEKDVAPSSFVNELTSIINTKKKKEDVKKRSMEMAEKARKENGIKDASVLRPGMKIHHESFGDGVIMMANASSYSIKFKSGIKIFHR